MYVCLHIHIYVYIYMYIHIHIYMCLYTYIPAVRVSGRRGGEGSGASYASAHLHSYAGVGGGDPGPGPRPAVLEAAAPRYAIPRAGVRNPIQPPHGAAASTGSDSTPAPRLDTRFLAQASLAQAQSVFCAQACLPCSSGPAAIPCESVAMIRPAVHHPTPAPPRGGGEGCVWGVGSGGPGRFQSSGPPHGGIAVQAGPP